MTRILHAPTFKIGIKIGFALLAFWFLSKKLDYAQLPELFYSMSYPLLGVAAALQYLSITAAALRWKSVMRSLGFGERFAFYQDLYFKGFFFSQALPGSVGGDAVRLLALKEHGYGVADSLYGIFIDRVVGLIGLLLISLIALLFAPTYLGDDLLTAVFAIGVGGIAGFVILLLLHRVIDFTRWPRLHLLHELSKRFYAVYGSASNASYQISLSVLIHFLSILCIYAIAVAAHLGIEFGAFLCLMPLVILLTLLPISFAGWGVREGAMVALFSLSGASKEAIMSVSIAYGVILIVSSLPGLYTWLRSKHLA